MKIATFNGRLPVLLRWLESSTPDVVCLQELKAPQEKFPQAALAKLGYGAIWHGQKSWNGVAILARGVDPVETRRGLPGDADDAHSRYIEATIRGIIVGCLYLPNGNPAPGPKFDYKLHWFERLITHASELLSLDAPVALIGDYNVMPTDLDVYKPERWVDDALFRPEVRQAFTVSSNRAGRMPCASCIPPNASTPFGTTSGTRGRGMRGCASIISYSVPSWPNASLLPVSTVTCAAGTRRAIMPRFGSRFDEQAPPRY
jgi:exodeoxyribonuclease III